MRVNLELSQLLGLIDRVARDRSDVASGTYGHHADKVRVGIEDLQAALHQELDVEEFGQFQATDLEVHQLAVARFCGQWCAWRKPHPGEHRRCERCPLMPLTVGALQEQIRRVIS